MTNAVSAPARSQVGDRRVQKSRTALREALFALMLQQGWQRTRVQDICERANVARSTFYVHFADKEELLLSGLDELPSALRQRTPAAKRTEELLGFLPHFIEHVRTHAPLDRAVLRTRTWPRVRDRVRNALAELVREDLAFLALSGPTIDAAVQYVSGGLMEILAASIDGRTPLSEEQMDRLARQFTGALVSRLVAS